MPRDVIFGYVHLGCRATTDEALAEIDRIDARPALVEELLDFAAVRPDEQRQHPIVALGSTTIEKKKYERDRHTDAFAAGIMVAGDGVVRRDLVTEPKGKMMVAYLDKIEVGRALNLHWTARDWNTNVRFLVVFID